MSTVERLRAARALIERGWTQGAYARAANGEPIRLVDEDPVCWCIRGAIWHSGNDFDDEARDAVRALSAFAGGAPLSHWNDAPGRTQAEVLALFDRAIAAQEAGR